MQTKLSQIITFSVLSAIASGQQHYQAIRISAYPNETVGLTQSGPYVLPNLQSGVTLAALNANSNGLFAGQDAYYRTYEGNASGITSLQSIAGPLAQVWAINDKNTVVGYSEEGVYSDDYQAFVIESGNVHRIPTLGGVSDTAQGVSTNNLVAGHSMKSNGVIDAILWNGSKTVDLGSLGGTHYFSNTDRTFASDAWGVNAISEVVGSSWIPNGQQRAFLWKAGKMANLGTLGGKESSAVAINDSSVVVGASLLSNGRSHGFVYVSGKMYDINTLITGLKTGVYINGVSQLNNLGQILASGSDDNIYLLEPVA